MPIMETRCKNCGAEISIDANYCFKCGKVLRSKPVEANEKKNKKQAKIFKIFIGACLISLFFAGFFTIYVFFAYNKQNTSSSIKYTDTTQKKKTEINLKAISKEDLKIERIWKNGRIGYVFVTWTNNTERTFKKIVTVQAKAYNHNGDFINSNQRSFFAYERGNFHPGYEGSLKIPIDIKKDTRLSRIDCLIIKAR